jgi:hypothetical protein
MNSKITITRKRNFFGLFRSVNLSINGEKNGKLGSGKSVIIEKEPGDYELIVTIDMFKSTPFKFQLNENENKQIEVSNSKTSDYFNFFFIVSMFVIIVLDFTFKGNPFSEYVLPFLIIVPIVQIILFSTVLKGKFISIVEKAQ